MTLVRETLRDLQRALTSSGIACARLEAELLLMTAMHVQRASLYAKLAQPFPSDALACLEQLTCRRLRREPVAYITGHREFYGLTLHVAPGVLIPRPETELLVDEVLEYAKRHPGGRPLTIVDVGTGSGAIAIAIAVQLPWVAVIGIDCTSQALRIANLNLQRHNLTARVSLLCGDLLRPVSGPVDIIVSNPPYVCSKELPSLEPEISLYEPQEALDGGDDGMTVIRCLIPQAATRLGPGGTLIMELDPRQARQAQEIASDAFSSAVIRLSRDLAGHERVLVVQKDLEH